MKQQLEKVKSYLLRVGLSEEEIDKQLSNPQVASVYLTQIHIYENTYRIYEAEEIHSSVLEHKNNVTKEYVPKLRKK